MQITLSPRAGKIPQKDQCGVVSWKSFSRIIQGMVMSRELHIGVDEYVAGITIDEQGLAFRIEKK